MAKSVKKTVSPATKAAATRKANKLATEAKAAAERKAYESMTPGQKAKYTKMHNGLDLSVVANKAVATRRANEASRIAVASEIRAEKTVASPVVSQPVASPVAGQPDLLTVLNLAKALIAAGLVK
jgi:hypothetical protein